MMELKSLSAETEIKIKPYDIDAAGHVNNAVYLNWLEDLRIKLFEQIMPLEKLIEKNCYLAIGSTEIHYKFPLRLGDDAVGKMKIDDIKKGIIYLNAEINSNNKTAAKAKQKCVLIDIKTGRMLKEEEIKNLSLLK